MVDRKLLLQPGETLMVAGDTSDDVFRLRSGLLDVLVGSTDEGAKPAAQIKPGGLVGELAALAGTRRTATIKAAELSELSVYSRAEFEAMMGTDPELASEVSEIAIRRLDHNSLHRFISDHLDGLADDLQRSIEEHLTWRKLAAGTVLRQAGTTTEQSHLVLSGRLLGTNAKGVRTEYWPGALITPNALIAPATNTETMVASRDTTLLEADRSGFEELLAKHPTAVLALGRAMTTATTQRNRRRAASTVSIAVTADDPGDLVVEILAEAGRHGNAELVSSKRADGDLNWTGISQSSAGSPKDYRLSEYVHQLELGADHLLFETDRDLTEWSRRCIRQADRLLIVCSASPDEGEHRRISDLLTASAAIPERNRWLAILHPVGTDRPSGTAHLMDRHGILNVAHVLVGRPEDTARLARLVTGHSTSIVFGGGGARGFAHLGVLRALEEVGVPVDTLVGTSIGSVLAGFYATGNSHALMMELAAKHFANVLDYTIPVVALIKGERIATGLSEVFGDLEIEDLWHPFACVSTNLTQSSVEVHRRGSVAESIRASLAIPGVIPPVPFGDDLLVDGGVLNNLPIDVAQQEFTPGTIIAVDVAPRSGPHAHLDFGMSVSGWKAVADKIKHANHYPGTAAILLRSMVTASIRERDRLVEDDIADLYLLLPTHEVSMMDFHESRKVEAAGYELARPLIDEWLNAGGWPNARQPNASPPPTTS
ncbi:MAG: patatin-like phospholipase family protein [Acidimicrobiia bacterium]|nr:patatin-like phospholipase family protein [Acidimicrobiia bacterium]